MIPLNGGVYVALLNSTSKSIATFAACCSLLSYSATAVVSAAACTSYATAAFGAFPVEAATTALLVAFAILVLFGVKDSANVALAIFCFHLLTLGTLTCAGFIFVLQNRGEVFMSNMHGSLPTRNGDDEISLFYSLFLGYSVGLLGLTGFETSGA